MQAAVGDRIVIRGRVVGVDDQTGEIIEVHGNEGEPPYVVRFADGRSSLVFPGPDAVIRPRQSPE